MVEKTIELPTKDEEEEDDEEVEEEEEEVEIEDEEEGDDESDEMEDESEDEQHEICKKIENETIKIDNACEGMTEATKAVLATKKRQEEEYRLQYEARRKEERERVEQELRSLREKQERRRLEREQEEKELAEKMRLAEEKHRQEEEFFQEESKARIEAQKRKREEERCKKQAMLAGSLAGIVSSGNNCNSNFVIQKPGKVERNKNDKGREEREEAKRAYMATVNQKPDISHFLINDLKNEIQELHSRVCKLEALKYDLEKRHERQLYDLKELHEREKQVARHRAVQRGLDPNEAAASPHPPKINVASKFDRQFDRRSYGDRRIIFEKVTFHGSLNMYRRNKIN
uniref:Troponin T n=1 Tax=Elaeophora elaphi TaxID=1147741 RepID=A0A0R3S5W2_9BILA